MKTARWRPIRSVTRLPIPSQVSCSALATGTLAIVPASFLTLREAQLLYKILLASTHTSPIGGCLSDICKAMDVKTKLLQAIDEKDLPLQRGINNAAVTVSLLQCIRIQKPRPRQYCRLDGCLG